jgi:hypothetical protein
MLLLITSRVPAQVIVAYQSDWKYVQNGVVQNNTNWTAPGFNDGSWTSGRAPFGFGSNSGYSYNTTLQRGPNNTTPNYPVFYFRKTFTVSNVSQYGRLRLRATLDDGIVIYIGGVEVARKNMTPSQNGYAGTPLATPATIDTVLSTSFLQNGNNTIAVELHQTGETSSDIYFDAQLEGQAVTLFRYPYLQLASHNRIMVCWYTNTATNATVRYSTNPNMTTYKEVSVSKSDTLHMVTLLNLTPDTRYYYSVGYNTGNDFKQLQYSSSVNYFHTQPDPADTTRTRRFWLLGDSGAGKYQNPRPYNVRNAYLAYLNAKNNPDVDGIIFLGDNSNTSPYEGLQTALDTTLFKFYNRPNDQQLLSHIPSWTVIGNHDYEPDDNYINRNGVKVPIRKAYHKQTAASFSTFAYPDSAQIGGEPTYNKKGYYSFNQGNIHFVVLNPPLVESSDVRQNWETQFSTTSYFDLHSFNSIALNDSTLSAAIDSLPQVKWLVKDLKANKQKWTVVTFHLPPFSTIGHIPDLEKDLQRVRDKLLPILEKPEYHVDALIVSHSHAYERAGMIRKNGAANRTSDYTQTGGLAGNGNLGRYPATKPYIKTNSETAYTYVLSGSAGRGWYNPNNTSENDAGFPPGTANVNHPNTSSPPLDNLTGDNSIDFYHIKGGSVELVFQETRLDVKFIKESDTSPMYTIADSFVVMKDVNRKKTITIQNGGDAVKLTASWIGTYNWYSAQQPGTLLASGTRSFSTGPTSNSTFYVRDQNGYLADTFIVNVTNPGPVITADTLIRYKSQWLYPLGAGFSSKDVKLDTLCIAKWTFSSPAFEMPANAPMGLGHNDEVHRISNALIEKVVVPAQKLWFRRSFILNGSVETYAGFKLTLLRDKNLGTRKSYTTSLQSLLINGQAAEITATDTKEVANGREEVTYTLSNKGFAYGLNYLLVSYYLTPVTSMVFPINATNDPFTFDALLLGTPAALAPPPLAKQFKLGTIATGPQDCAGDTVNVQFAAAGNESGFPIVYEARLVTASGDVPIGEGTASPIIGMLPRNLQKGSYPVKVATKNAFMADQSGPSIQVSEPAAATILPAPADTVWKGEKIAIQVHFAGTGPWQYTLPDSTGGATAVADTVLQTKTRVSGPYALSSVRNGCGNGQISGSVEVLVKEPILATGKPARLSFAPRKTALCNGDSVSVSYAVTGPAKQRTYTAEISDVSGDFAKPVALVSGTASPLKARLPVSLMEGDQYRVRIRVTDPDVDFTLTPSEQISLRKTAEAEFALSKMAVYEGEELKLDMLLSGTLPVSYYLRYGTDTFSGESNDPVIQRTLTLKQTTEFSLDSVRNVCGYGAVGGSRTVTVSLVVGVDPLLTKDIIAYPNPSTQTLLLKSKRPWQKNISWRIVSPNGQLIRNGTITTGSGAPLEIDVSLLPSGLYVLEVEHGTPQSSSWRIVKK